MFLHKKSLKILKGLSESVYRRRTDNTMATRKKYKWTLGFMFLSFVFFV